MEDTRSDLFIEVDGPEFNITAQTERGLAWLRAHWRDPDPDVAHDFAPILDCPISDYPEKLDDTINKATADGLRVEVVDGDDEKDDEDGETQAH